MFWRKITVGTGLAVLVWLAVGSVAQAATAQGRDLDCGDFGSRNAAQDVLDANPSDVHRLDADDDGNQRPLDQLK